MEELARARIAASGLTGYHSVSPLLLIMVVVLVKYSRHVRTPPAVEMQAIHSRCVRGAPFSKFFLSVHSAVFAVLLSSCSSGLPVQRDAQQAHSDELAPAYSLVCVIHGDGDYLYHDTSGNEYEADEEALAGASGVALRNPSAEVFIFHQKPRRHFLFFFPLPDGEFSYYRNGRLIANASYFRGQGQSRFDPEVELYRRFRADVQPTVVRLFLYCGHEVPETGGKGYDASYPDRAFTVRDLAGGVRRFTPHAERFDLMVLSTCFGGTPYTIGTLGPSARYIIASPDNLHLSYFDLHSLERLDLCLRDGDVPAFAARFAHQAFDRLTRDIQTAVSVAVYDVDRVQEFVRSVRTVYDRTLNTLNQDTQASAAALEHCDCSDLPAYMLPTMNDGVDIIYRPARFGRAQRKQNHSGWECWRDSGPQAATPRTTEPVLK